MDETIHSIQFHSLSEFEATSVAMTNDFNSLFSSFQPSPSLSFFFRFLMSY